LVYKIILYIFLYLLCRRACSGISRNHCVKNDTMFILDLQVIGKLIYKLPLRLVKTKKRSPYEDRFFVRLFNKSWCSSMFSSLLVRISYRNKFRFTPHFAEEGESKWGAIFVIAGRDCNERQPADIDFGDGG
jgi:hypothetical protein